eukprot:2609604-Pyramimonas_sp.AAC.1
MARTPVHALSDQTNRAANFLLERTVRMPSLVPREWQGEVVSNKQIDVPDMGAQLNARPKENIKTNENSGVLNWELAVNRQPFLPPGDS